MPPRTKKNSGAQPPLTAPLPAPAPGFEVPRLLRYLVLGETAERWQVERFDLLAAEFAMVVKSVTEAEETAQAFHTFAAEHPMPWRVVRRLFGIAPMVPQPMTHPDDLRIWTREEMQRDGDWNREEIDSHVAGLRTMWRAHLSRQESARQAETVSTKLEAPPGELALDDTLLEKFQFSPRIFKIKIYDPAAGADGTGAEVARSDSENRIERDWFAGRVAGWRKMLEDPMGAPVARSALMNDLYLRRMEYEIAVSPSQRREKLLEQQQRLTRDYNTSIERLQEMFPDLAVAGRVTFRAVLSDVIIGHRDYYSRDDRRLADKVFTASEIEFQLRSSLQLDAPYRFSLGLAIVECVHNLYDPEFRSQFKPTTLKKIDAMVKAAREAALEIQSEPVVDLERGVSLDEPDQHDDFNDEQCQEPVKGRPCGIWNPAGKPCRNAKAHDQRDAGPE